MIHAVRPDVVISNANPFYLLVDGIPMPLAVKNGNQEALSFRDEWEAKASHEEKVFCLYHPVMRNWVCGWIDGLALCAEAEAQ